MWVHASVDDKTGWTCQFTTRRSQSDNDPPTGWVFVAASITHCKLWSAVQSLVEEVRPCHSHAVNTTVGWQDLQRGILQKIYMNKFGVCGTTGQPTQNATYKNANNIYMFQRITSWLLHIIFSFCMIIPQSFQFTGQIVPPPRFLSLGISEGLSGQKQLPDNQWLKHSNYSQDQG